jgi:hypothetical protein
MTDERPIIGWLMRNGDSTPIPEGDAVHFQHEDRLVLTNPGGGGGAPGMTADTSASRGELGRADYTAFGSADGGYPPIRITQHGSLAVDAGGAGGPGSGIPFIKDESGRKIGAEGIYLLGAKDKS